MLYSSKVFQAKIFQHPVFLVNITYDQFLLPFPAPAAKKSSDRPLHTAKLGPANKVRAGYNGVFKLVSMRCSVSFFPFGAFQGIDLTGGGGLV